jgi:4-hydroxy-3-polyprenylbenzoate decarboxylase
MGKSDRSSLRRRAIGDLRAFVEIAEKQGDLMHVEGADPDREIGAIYELSLEHLYPPTLLFSNMKGCDPTCRIVMNVRTSKFMVGNLDMEAVREARRRGARKSVDPIEPRLVNTGPVLENVVAGDAVDIYKFPAPIWHADDGGPYLGTECLIITKDPDSDWVNVGTYRVEMHDKKTITIFIEPGKHGDMIRRKYWERGKHCPFVVSFGQAPVLGGVSRVAFAPGVSELAQAGGQLGRPIDIVKGQLTGLPIPADAEVVFEGYMPPLAEDSREEGPFGEWPGYYTSGKRPEPVVRVERIYHRNNPIIIGQPPVRPTLPGRHTHIAGSAALWDALEAAGVPGVEGVWKMSAAGTRFANVIALRQQFAGHAKMAGLVATGAGPAAYMGRMTIIVDDDIDITNDREVLWALATRWDPRTQTDIIDGCWSGHLDPTIPAAKRESGDITNSRIIIYAVRPYHWKDEFPRVNAIAKDYAEEVREKWQEQLPFLAKPKR